MPDDSTTTFNAAGELRSRPALLLILAPLPPLPRTSDEALMVAVDGELIVSVAFPTMLTVDPDSVTDPPEPELSVCEPRNARDDAPEFAEISTFPLLAPVKPINPFPEMLIAPGLVIATVFPVPIERMAPLLFSKPPLRFTVILLSPRTVAAAVTVTVPLLLAVSGAPLNLIDVLPELASKVKLPPGAD